MTLRLRACAGASDQTNTLDIQGGRVCTFVCPRAFKALRASTWRGEWDWAGMGWAGIMSDILRNLYLQSRVFFHANETHLIRICLMGHMQNMRQLIPSLVFHRADWQRPERASRRACLQNPILICLMVSGSQKSQISCQLFMRLFSRPIDAPRLINTSLRRCDYMLELLIGPLNFKDHHKRCFDKQSWGKRDIWWVSLCLLLWDSLFVFFPFYASIIRRAAALEGSALFPFHLPLFDGTVLVTCRVKPPVRNLSRRCI